MTIMDNILEDNSSVRSLMQDKDSKRLILHQLSKEIQDRPEPIWDYPCEQVLAMTLSAKFASEEESIRVGNLINYTLNVAPFPFALLSEPLKNTYWSERGLLGLGIFHGFYESRWERRAAPKPEQYERQSIHVLLKNNEGKFASHFHEWIDFLRFNFPLTQNYPTNLLNTSES